MLIKPLKRKKTAKQTNEEPKLMNIIFLGTPELASKALNKLNNGHHDILAVVTQPDRQSGRGRKIIYSPVKQFAIDNDLKILQYEKISDEEALNELESLHPDVFVCVAYAQKLPDRLLNMAPYGCINLHPSLLPRYRGSAPLRGAILNGDKRSGVTIMQLSSEWDAGDILLQREFDIDPKDTVLSLEDKVNAIGGDMLNEVLDSFENGTVHPVPQDHSKATYIKQITKQEGLINFEDPAELIERQIRACIPWPSAFTSLNGKTFKIYDADVCEDIQASDSFTAGQAVEVSKNRLIVKCGTGSLKLNEVQLEGKKRMPACDFLRGYAINTGDIFG